MIERKSQKQHSMWKINDIICRHRIAHAMINSYNFVHDILQNTILVMKDYDYIDDETWFYFEDELIYYDNITELLNQSIPQKGSLI